MPSGGKELSKITYEDLLISSKYFYTEGNPGIVAGSRNCPASSRGDCLTASDSKGNIDSKEISKHQEILDIDVAIEAACGDPNFLVSRSTYGSMFL